MQIILLNIKRVLNPTNQAKGTQTPSGERNGEHKKLGTTERSKITPESSSNDGNRTEHLY